MGSLPSHFGTPMALRSPGISLSTRPGCEVLPPRPSDGTRSPAHLLTVGPRLLTERQLGARRCSRNCSDAGEYGSERTEAPYVLAEQTVRKVREQV